MLSPLCVCPASARGKFEHRGQEVILGLLRACEESRSGSLRFTTAGVREAVMRPLRE
jgi:hypothetical protein